MFTDLSGGIVETLGNIDQKSGAEARNRTGMMLPSLDFESSASTNFATSAWGINLINR